MRLIEELNPFSEDVRRLAEAWRENAVVSGEHAYTYITSIGRGNSQPAWHEDENGNLVVVKIQNGNAGVARGKIVAEFAHYLGLPVPPGRIWAKPCKLSGKDIFHSVSLKAFPEVSEEDVPRHIYEKDPFFPAIGIFDSWIVNVDRAEDNILYNKRTAEKGAQNAQDRTLAGENAEASHPELAYFDHEYALIPEFYAVGKLKDPANWGNRISTLFWADDPRGLEQLKTPQSLTRIIYDRLIDMSDSVIAEIVDIVPDAVYSRAEKGRTIQMLRDGRDVMALAMRTLAMDSVSPEEQRSANQALWDSATRGDRRAARDALVAGAELNAADGRAVYLAAENGHHDLLQFLFLATEDPDLSHYRRAFLRAAECGHLHSAEVLSEKLFKAEPWFETGIPAFDGTVVSLQKDIKRIVSNASDAATASALVSASADKIRHAIRRRLNDELHEACKDGLWDKVEDCTRRGADINSGDGFALYRAIQAGEPENVRRVMDLGAHVRIDNDLAMRVAIRRDRWDIVEQLVQRIFEPAEWRDKNPADRAADLKSLAALAMRYSDRNDEKGQCLQDIFLRHSGDLGAQIFPGQNGILSPEIAAPQVPVQIQPKLAIRALVEPLRSKTKKLFRRAPP